jgi:hypothetical protein
MGPRRDAMMVAIAAEFFEAYQVKGSRIALGPDEETVRIIKRQDDRGVDRFGLRRFGLLVGGRRDRTIWLRGSSPRSPLPGILSKSFAIPSFFL